VVLSYWDSRTVALVPRRRKSGGSVGIGTTSNLSMCNFSTPVGLEPGKRTISPPLMGRKSEVGDSRHCYPLGGRDPMFVVQAQRLD